MAWEPGNQVSRNLEDYNSIVKELTGNLTEVEAKITLAKFLKTNLGFTWELLTGMKLEYIQEICLKGLFLGDDNLIIAGRGGSKSSMIGFFSMLYACIYSGKRITVISSNFRRARSILDELEKIRDSKNAVLLQQCFPDKIQKAPDMYRWKAVNGSEIQALPLSGGAGIRGHRCECALVDEGLLLNKEVLEDIIRPMLTAKQDFREQEKIKKVEDELIERGKITERDRISFPRNKFSIFSSMSYKFQYLYEQYQNAINAIRSPNQEKDAPRKFVMRFSYEALPENTFLDLTQINIAKQDLGFYSDTFTREYRALAPDGDDSYFNIKKLFENTLPPGTYPSVQFKGDPQEEYVLSIDPAYSARESSDWFSMSLYQINRNTRDIINVHNFGRAGAGQSLKEQYVYLVYLLRYFNIVWVSLDSSGSEFIEGFNESTVAKEYDINLKFLTADLDKDDYLKEIQTLKQEYSQTNGRIVYLQGFASHKKRIMFEHLQNQINSKKIWFASSIIENDQAFKRAINLNIPLETFRNKESQKCDKLEYIEAQMDFQDELKAQLGLIQCFSTPGGQVNFDLPQSMRRSTAKNRPRKDLAVCMVMAVRGAKYYFDMWEKGKVSNKGNLKPFFAA